MKPTSLLPLIIAIFLMPAVLRSQAQLELKLGTGKEIFEAACIGCHGPGGKGQPQSTLGFEPPSTFPDFSDCNGSTREKTYDWRATIHEGGPARGFSEIMPSFADALSPDQIRSVIGYLRSLCRDSSWPLGELNFPRALVTEKAFPEDEALITTSLNTNGAGGVSTTFVYEKRFGARNQIEIGAPFQFLERNPGSWVGGIGDMVIGYKRVVFQNRRSGSIFSLQGEAIAPVGNKHLGFGSGVTVFETFGAFGQAFPGLAFLQLQGGVEAPTDSRKSARAGYWRATVGKTLAGNQGFDRSWTPMVEILADKDFEAGAKTNWDAVPQMQVTLNKRQHVRLNVGVRRPINDSGLRSTQLMFYVLWDWFDGGFREGW